jgi:hypothetical protein
MAVKLWVLFNLHFGVFIQVECRSEVVSCHSAQLLPAKKTRRFAH